MKHLALLAGMALFAASGAASSQAYFGAAVGNAKIKNGCQGAPSSASCDDKDSGWKFVVGHRFTPHLGVEIAYSELGAPAAHASGFGPVQNAELTALELTAIGSWPIARRFELYGKLGVYRGEMEARDVSFPTIAIFPPPPPPPTPGWRSDSNTGFTYGVGASFALTEHALARLEWQRYPKLGGSPELDIDVVSLGALYRF